MRKTHTDQHSIFDFYPEHEFGCELKWISNWLDQNPYLMDWVRLDVKNECSSNTGRSSITAESVLRCAIIKQTRQLSYEDLAFYLQDSLSCQTFARLDRSKAFPKKSALQSAISRISDETWELINLQLLESAQQNKIESGKTIRIDSTVTDTNIHEPTDSTLLWDSARTLIRLLKQAEELMGRTFDWVNHQRGAKKKMHQIFNTRGMKKKVPLYKALLKYVENCLAYIKTAKINMLVHATNIMAATLWKAEVDHFVPLILKVIDQTKRRVLNGEKVPATEKLFSLFEEHTDIIIKGSRDIQYGHKLNLSTGKSGLILDMVVETGNPADSEQFIPMINRHIENYGKPPRQSAADGGYASTANVTQAKELGVKDVAFHKKRGLAINDMVKSKWVYKQLRNFRAGVEANISVLKRTYGMARCLWKGWGHFNSYIWSTVVSYNLTLFARLCLKST
jgi:IS5 family transposase